MKPQRRAFVCACPRRRPLRPRAPSVRAGKPALHARGFKKSGFRVPEPVRELIRVRSWCAAKRARVNRAKKSRKTSLLLSPNPKP